MTYFDVLFIEIKNKVKYNYSVVSFPKLLPKSVVQWVRGFTTNLKVMSSNGARDFKIFTFPNFFITFFLKCEI